MSNTMRYDAICERLRVISESKPHWDMVCIAINAAYRLVTGGKREQ